MRRTLHGLPFQVKCRNDFLRHRFHFHLSGSLDQDPVSLFQPGPKKRDNLLRVLEKRDPIRRESPTDRPGRQSLRQGSLEKEVVNVCIRKKRPDFLMQCFRSFAQLQHVAQNRNGAAVSPQSLQGLQGLPYRGGIGVVGVDDQEGAVSEPPDLGPPGDRAEGGEARRDLMTVETQRP